MRGLCGKKTQAWEMWPNGWPDWHQLWCTHADSSRKGSWPKKISGGLGLGGGESEIQKSEKAHVNTHMHIHLQRVVGQLGGGSVGGGGGGRGSEIQKSEKAHVNTHTHSSTNGSRPNKN